MALRSRLSRYKEFARFVAKYGRAEFVTQAAAGSAVETAGDAAEAQAFAADLEKLGPTFIKLGQILSTPFDLLPQPYLDASPAFKTTLGSVSVRRRRAHRVRTSSACGLSKAFDSFQPEPIAAASLGQVHRAVVRGGREGRVGRCRRRTCGPVLKDLDALDEVAALMQAVQRGTRAVEAQGRARGVRRTLLLELD
jgi:predicted unusual protein kinase regulating ubiquinone biosynthesis (AarF/ABC1/UbiB family)